MFLKTQIVDQFVKRVYETEILVDKPIQVRTHISAQLKILRLLVF